MATNKVVYGNTTLIDLTSDTASASDVVSGKTFHSADGVLRTGSMDLSEYYSTNDTAETDIADGDYFPFYDTSATAKKKSLWSNIKSVLKTYFDTTYSNKISSPSAGKFVVCDANGVLSSSSYNQNDFGDAVSLNEYDEDYTWQHSESGTTVTTYEHVFYQSVRIKSPGTMASTQPIKNTFRISQDVTLSTSQDTTVVFGGQISVGFSTEYFIANGSTRQNVSIVTTSINDISYKSCEVDTSEHTCTIVFPPYSSAASMKVEIFLY